MRYAFIVIRNIALLLLLLLVAEVSAILFDAVSPFSPFAGTLSILLQILLAFYFLVKTGEELYCAKDVVNTAPQETEKKSGEIKPIPKK